MSLSQQRRWNKSVPLILTLLIVTLSLFIATRTQAQNYDREASLYNQMIEKGGCVWSECPNLITQATLEETNGLYPPQYYQKDTKDYWRSFCTYSPNECK